MYDFFTCMYMYVYVPPEYLVPTEVRECVKSPGNGIMNGCKKPYCCQKSNPSPLPEQQVF